MIFRGFFCIFMTSALTLTFYTSKHVYLRFLITFCFWQFFGHFLRLLQAWSKLILFYTKFSVNWVILSASTWTRSFQLFNHFLWVLEARSKLILFYTKCSANRVKLLASTCTILLLQSKLVQRNYRHFFRDFKPRSKLKVLIKIRFLVKIHLMEIILVLKIRMDQVKRKKNCYRYFCRIMTSALTLRAHKPVYLRFSSIVCFLPIC